MEKIRKEGRKKKKKDATPAPPPKPPPALADGLGDAGPDRPGPTWTTWSGFPVLVFVAPLLPLCRRFRR